LEDFQEYISSVVGGMALTSTVEGRERYPIRVRYAREFRDNPEDLKKLLISTPVGVQIPLSQLATIEYTKGPQLIKSENTLQNKFDSLIFKANNPQLYSFGLRCEMVK
jgi:Cu(I)/Ag(I) efflux system membrane protein CusA/SilA